MTRVLRGLIFLTTIFANAAQSQEHDKLVPYDIQSKFREVGCEIIHAHKAARTDLDRQRIYIAECSGVDTYLMAVKCQGIACRVLH